jgi:hypothetical protein
MKKSSEIVIYKNQNGENQIDVRLENETIWLTQEQISSLFEVDRTVITKHLKNIFASQELDEKSNVQKMHIAGSDKPVKFYNLDGIISVGYRVNSKRATQFRIWATSILKDHLVKGFTVNQKRLSEIGLTKFEETIALVKKVIHSKKLENTEVQGLLDIIASYIVILGLKGRGSHEF